MKLTKIIPSLVFVLLIGCTAVTDPTPQAYPLPPDVPQETAVPTAPQEVPVSEEEPLVTDPEPTPTEEGKQVSEPVTVNLGEVTAVPINTTPIVQPAPGNPGLKDPVVIAMEDLSQRLGVAVEDIELVSLLEVTWSDGSLGCPQAGMAYTQALVPGQQMILQVDGQDYYYHSGKNSVFSYCGNPVPPLDSMPTNSLQPIPGQDD